MTNLAAVLVTWSFDSGPYHDRIRLRVLLRPSLYGKASSFVSSRELVYRANPLAHFTILYAQQTRE